MNEKTLGQINHDAYMEKARITTDWKIITDSVKVCWEAGAQAVVKRIMDDAKEVISRESNPVNPA